MFDNIFEIVFLAFFILGVAIRAVMVFRVPQWWKKKANLMDDQETGIDKVLLSLNSLGLLFVPLVYLFSPWLDFADYFLPPIISHLLGWSGAAVFIFALYLLYKSHADLGHDFSPELNLREEHKLVTDGIFRHIRHPMYAAHLLWAVAQILLLQNWIAGPVFLVTSLPVYIIRIPREERMMIISFGEDYRDYMKTTGCVFPRLSKHQKNSLN
ncbi:MAG: protein-S-isoprenylcysteine O-methyltransferase [Candidatus Aminicenantes bacterium]|jgi:protein-S-isoprenylcysteine O-methyltransferase Ste14